MSAPGRWSFLPVLFLFTLVCSFGLVLALRGSSIPFRPHHSGALLFFFLLTALMHAWQEGSMARDPDGFVRRFMAGLVLKMMASFLVLLTTVLVLPRSEVLTFAVPFMLLYLAFTALSTVRLTRMLRTLPAP